MKNVTLKHMALVGSIVPMACILASCALTPERRVIMVDQAALPVATAHYNGPEAQAACDTPKMRKRVLDHKPTNDIVPVTVLRELQPGVESATMIDVNCREVYATHFSVGWAALPPTHYAAPVRMPYGHTGKPLPVISDATETKLHQVRSGDTRSSIAERYCTTWAKIAARNALSATSQVRLGDILVLPEEGC